MAAHRGFGTRLCQQSHQYGSNGISCLQVSSWISSDGSAGYCSRGIGLVGCCSPPPALPPWPTRRAPCGPTWQPHAELSTQPSLPALPSQSAQLPLQPLGECRCSTPPPLPTVIRSFILRLLGLHPLSNNITFSPLLIWDDCGKILKPDTGLAKRSL